MNEKYNNILNRRSTKNFKDTPVSDELLDAIAKAGTYAPSGKNAQAATIVVIKNKEVRDQLSKMNAKVLGNENMDPFYGAPYVFVVFADKEKFTYLYDGSLVMGNLMLAAESLGVGSCWIHRAKEMFESEEGKALMKKWGLKESLEGIGNCVIGYPAAGPLKEIVRKDDYIIEIK